MDVRVRRLRELSAEELMLLNCGVVLEKTLENPMDCKEIKPVNPRGNQSWLFIGRTDAETEIPILWPPDAKNWLIGKDLYAGKDWSWEEKGMTEGEMVRWHHRLHGYEFEQALGVGQGQGSLVCCSPLGRTESEMTEWLNWIDINYILIKLGVAKDQMIREHHWLNGHKFEQTLGDSGGQQSLVCCSPWSQKALDITWWLNNDKNETVFPIIPFPA